MSLILTCDSCGASISKEDLQGGKAFEHEGSHYCERCKAPILAFLKKGGKSPAAPAKPPAPALRDPLADLEALEEFDDLDDLEVESPAPRKPSPAPPIPPKDVSGPPAVKRPPLPGRPGPLAPRPPAGPAGAARPAGAAAPRPGPVAKAPAPPAQRPPSPRSPSPASKVGPSKRPLAGAPAPRAAPVGPARRPGAIPARPGPLAGPLKSRGAAPLPAPEVEAPEAGEEAGGAPPSKRKKVYLLGGIGAGVAMVLLATVYFLTRGPGQPEPPRQDAPASAPQAKAEKAVPRESSLELEKRRELDALRGRLSDDPAKLLALRADLGSYVPLEEMGKDYQALVEEAEKRLEAARQRVLADTRKKCEEYKQKENFEAAAVLWNTVPDVIARSELRAKWIEEGGKLASLGAAWARWTKIEEKVDKYLAQDDFDISEAILTCEDNLPKDCDRRFPEIWRKREERLSDLRVNREKVRKEIHDRVIARREKERQLEKERKRKEREQDWLEKLAKTPPAPLIARDGNDLENWSHRPAIQNRENILDSRCPWAIQSIDGQQTIVGSGEDEEIQLGMNGNRWLDWVLEFEAKVESESLHLKTRTKVEGSVLFTRIVSEAPKQFDFPSSSYGGWTKFRVESRVDKVYLFEGEDKKPKMEVETPDQEGGFAFSLDAKGSVKLRNIQLQLVHDNKRPREEEEEEGEGE